MRPRRRRIRGALLSAAHRRGRRVPRRPTRRADPAGRRCHHMAALDLASPPVRTRRPPRQSWFGTGACTLVLLVMGLFVLYPLVLLVYGSFLFEQPGGGKVLGFGAWIAAWDQPGMAQAIINTFKRSVVTEILSLPLAIMIAWLVARPDLPGKRLIDNFFWIA